MGKLRWLGGLVAAFLSFWLGANPASAQYPPEIPPGMLPPGPPLLDFGADAPGDANQWSPRWELSSEAVFFFFQRPQVTFPLVTAGDPADALPGAVGQPGTTVLAGNNPFLEHLRVGGRLTAKWWFTEAPEWMGLEASYFIMQQANTAFTATNQGGAGDPVLARPFFNVPLGMEDAVRIGSPGLFSGVTNIGFATRLMGADANLLVNVSGYNRLGPNLFILGGPRYIRFDERFTSTDVSTDLATNNVLFLQDRFATTNTFYGGQLGTLFRYRMQRVSFDLLSKVAVGVNEQTLAINGFTSVSNPTGAILASGNQGLFAQQSNIGEYSHRAISIIPEVGVKLRLDITDSLRFTAGYGYLNMSRAVRPADQLDRNSSISNLGTGGLGSPARPTSITETTFWSQYFSFGLELVF